MELCKTHDLDTKGKKADLQERLTEFLNSQSTDAPSAEPEATPLQDLKSETPSSQEKSPEELEEEPAPAEKSAPLPDFKAEKPSSQELPTESEPEPASAQQTLPDFKTEKPASQELPAEDEPAPVPEEKKEETAEKEQNAPAQ